MSTTTQDSQDTQDYVVLIIGDAARWTTTMSAQERAAGYAEYGRFQQQLAARGHEVVDAAQLHAPDTARTVRPGGGPVTDGPFAEVAEQVGGYFHIRSGDVEDLVQACRIIADLGDSVEVRPVVSPQQRSST